MSMQVWTEKYRPEKLSEIVNQINWIRKDGKASKTAGLKLSDTPPSGK